MTRILDLLVLIQIPWLAARAQYVTQYKTVSSSGGYLYETDTLDSGMSVPRGIATHTITAAFSLKKPDGTVSPFSDTQQGDASGYFDPTTSGDVSIAEIGNYLIEQDDDGVCSVAGTIFTDDVYSTYIPPPELDAVTNWATSTDMFPVDSSGTMVLWGYALLCEDTCSDGEISFSFSPADSNVQTSISEAYDQQINLNFTINAGAIAGTHTVCISTPFPPASCSTFIVGDGTPVITSISPSSFQAGSTYTGVVILGSNLGTACPMVTITGGGSTKFTPTQCFDNSVTGTIVVDPNADPNAPANTLGALIVTSNGFGNGWQSQPGVSQGSGPLGVNFTPPPPPTLAITSNGSPVVQGGTIANNNCVQVAATPAMPQLTFALVGASNPTAPVQWDLNIDWARPGGGADLAVLSPPSAPPASAGWTPAWASSGITQGGRRQ